MELLTIRREELIIVASYHKISQMKPYYKIWIDQCEAAQGIKEQYGIKKALGYLIGEKLVNFVEAAYQDSAFDEELPKFIAEIKAIFQSWEIKEYLDSLERVGVLGHVCTDEQYETLHKSGAIPDDPVGEAEDIIMVERV